MCYALQGGSSLGVGVGDFCQPVNAVCVCVCERLKKHLEHIH